MNEKFTDERISAFLDDELSADERAAVERELADNVGLRQAVDELRALRAGLQSLPRYRMETNIAERVLELAEREVLTGRGSEESCAAAEDDGRPQPVRPSSAPSAGREATFSWRNLAWSATAAGVAALMTNYYHVSNRADERGDNVVASADESAGRSEEEAVQASNESAGPGSLSADPNADAGYSAGGGTKAYEDGQGLPDDAGLDRAPMADVVARDAPGAAERQQFAPGQPSDDSANGLGGAAPDLAAYADRAMENRAFGGGARPNAAPAGDVATAAESFAKPGGNAGRGQFRGSGFAETATSAVPASIVVVHMTADAMRRRAFDDVLSANRVAMLDESRSGGGLARRWASDGSAGGGADGKADAPVENDGAANERAFAQSALASGGVGPDDVGPEVVEVDVTPEQLANILAAVDGRAEDFSVSREFPLAAENELRDRFGVDRDVRADGVADGKRRATADAKPALDEVAADFQRGGAQPRPERPERAKPNADEPEPSSEVADSVAADESLDSPLKQQDKPRAAPHEAEVPKDKAGLSPAPAAPEKKSASATRAVAPRAAAPRAAAPRAAVPRDSAAAEASPREGKDAESDADDARDAKVGAREQDVKQRKDATKPPPPADAPSRDAAKGERDATSGEADAADRDAAKSQAEPSSPADVATADAGPPDGYARRVLPRRANERAPRRDMRNRRADSAEALAPPSADAVADAVAEAVADPKATTNDDAATRHAADPAFGGRSPELAKKAAASEGELTRADAQRIRVYFLLQPAVVGPAVAAPAADAGSGEPPATSND